MINEAKAVRVMKTRTAIRAKPGHFMPSLSSAKLLILISCLSRYFGVFMILGTQSSQFGWSAHFCLGYSCMEREKALSSRSDCGRCSQAVLLVSRSFPRLIPLGLTLLFAVGPKPAHNGGR